MGFVACSCLGLVGACAKPAAVAPTPQKAVVATAPSVASVDHAADVRRWLAREMPEVPEQPFAVLDGLIKGAIESKSNPDAGCAKDKFGETLCVINAELGADSDGTPMTIACNVHNVPANIGTHAQYLLSPLKGAPKDF